MSRQSSDGWFNSSKAHDCPSTFGTLLKGSGDSPEANPHALGNLPQGKSFLVRAGRYLLPSRKSSLAGEPGRVSCSLPRLLHPGRPLRSPTLAVWHSPGVRGAAARDFAQAWRCERSRQPSLSASTLGECWFMADSIPAARLSRPPAGSWALERDCRALRYRTRSLVCAKSVPRICIFRISATSGILKNQQLTRGQYGSKVRGPLPSRRERSFVDACRELSRYGLDLRQSRGSEDRKLHLHWLQKHE